MTHEEPTIKKNSSLTIKEESANNNSIIIIELKELLQNYLKENSNITENAFFLKNRLSSSTINNLLNGVTKKLISSETVGKIVCVINRGKTIGYTFRNAKGEGVGNKK